MGRRPVPFLQRIAALTGHTEASLAEVLNDPSSDHLVWQGAIHPRIPTAVTHSPRAAPAYIYRYVKQPEPRMNLAGKMVSPARALFCHFNGLEDLSPHHMVRCVCQHRFCINPHHHVLQGRHVRGEAPEPLPLLKGQGTDPVDAPPEETIDDLIEDLKERGLEHQPLPVLLKHYFGIWTEDEVRTAFEMMKG